MRTWLGRREATFWLEVAASTGANVPLPVVLHVFLRPFLLSSLYRRIGIRISLIIRVIRL